MILDILAGMAGSARLGPVRVGAHRDEVTAVLGPPPAAGPPGRDGEPHLYVYGDLELHTCRCQLVDAVRVAGHRERIELPAALVGPGHVFPGPLAQDDVLGALERAGLVWEPHTVLTFGEQRAVVVPATRTTLVFTTAPDTVPVLHALSLPGGAHRCPSRRTVSPSHTPPA